MTDELNTERVTKFELLLEFVEKHGYKILGIIGLSIAAVGLVLTDFTVPRRGKLILLVAAIVSPIGKWTGDYVVSILYDPNFIYLVDLDASEVDGALFEFPYDDFSELEVIEGQLCELTPRLYTGKDVSLEDQTVRGTWRGSMSDRELLRALTKIKECRGTLEDDAKRGFAIETQAFTIVRAAVRKATMKVVQTFEHGTLPDEGESIGAEVDAALDEYDLESELRDIDESDPEPEPADLEDDHPGDPPEADQSEEVPADD